jgi:hypothetical protein
MDESELYRKYCRSCDHCSFKGQYHYWNESGTSRLLIPYIVIKPYCWEYSLHLDHVIRLNSVIDTGDCFRYHSQGIS